MDREALHGLGHDVLGGRSPGDLTDRMLSALLQAVGGEVAGEIEFDLRADRASALEKPALLLPAAADRDVSATLNSNPALPHLVSGRRLDPVAVSDLCGERAWSRNPMRRVLLEPQGVPFALVCGYRSQRSVARGWGVNGSSAFSADALDSFGVLFPYLRRAAELRSWMRLARDLDRAVAGGAGLAVLEGTALVHLNAAALSDLDALRLPVAHLGDVVARALPPGVRRAVVPVPGGLLQLDERSSHVGRRVVVVRGRPAPADVAARLGLTPRQHEVLVAVAEGRGRDAVAQGLGLSTRTVDKHLERIFRCLGVGTRQEAVAVADELGLLLTDLPTVPRPRCGSG